MNSTWPWSPSRYEIALEQAQAALGERRATLDQLRREIARDRSLQDLVAVAVDLAMPDFEPEPTGGGIGVEVGRAGARVPGGAQVVELGANVGPVTRAHQRFGRRRACAAGQPVGAQRGAAVSFSAPAATRAAGV